MSPTRFQRVPVEELCQKSEDEILDYAARAKAEGERDEALVAIHLMLFFQRERMEDRVAMRLPRHLTHHRTTVATWVLDRVMKSALKLQLRGSSVGEWVVWWQTAIDRQVTSFWRSAQGQALEAETRLPSEHHQDETDAPRDTLGVPFDEEAVLFRAECGDIVRTVLDRVDNPMHVSVIQQAIFEDQPSADVAAAHDTTAGNVDAVTSRFRKAVRQECMARGIEP